MRPMSPGSPPGSGLAGAGREVLLVHWTGATDYPLSGDAATALFLRAAAPFASPTRQSRADRYRLDRLHAIPAAAAG